MTATEVQAKLDAIVADLQTTSAGKTANIMFRGSGNTPNVLQLSSNGGGRVDSGQLTVVQAIVDDMKSFLTTYNTEYAPVKAALETFNTERAGHQVLIDAASSARVALNTALEADAGYQTAKTALEVERADAGYIAAKAGYESNNVSENISELGQAKGSYTD